MKVNVTFLAFLLSTRKRICPSQLFIKLRSSNHSHPDNLQFTKLNYTGYIFKYEKT